MTEMIFLDKKLAGYNLRYHTIKRKQATDPYWSVA